MSLFFYFQNIIKYDKINAKIKNRKLKFEIVTFENVNLLLTGHT